MRVKAAPRRRSSSVRAATALLWASSSCIGFWEACITCLRGCQQRTQKRGPGDLRSFDVAEPRTADSKSWVDLECNIPYLSPDILTLAITIRPDVKNLRISCLRLNVTCYGLFILPYHEHEFQGLVRKAVHWSTYLCNETVYGSVEQISWWT